MTEHTEQETLAPATNGEAAASASASSPSSSNGDLPLGPEAQKTRTCRHSLALWGVVCALIVFVGVGSMYAVSTHMIELPVETGLRDGALEARLDEIEARTKRVEEGLTRLAGTPAASGGESAAQAPASGDEVEQLKTGLAGLSAALGQLQQELEKSSQVTSEDRMNTQAGLATIVAFFQMERHALSGKPFEQDRQVMRKLAEGDQELVDQLVALEPFAAQGVETPSRLYKLWRTKAVDAQAALRKAGAQTWFDRIVVALEGLISIHSVAPGASESLSFAAISMDLEDGDVQAAVLKAQALPSEVQETIKSWLDRATARAAVVKTLDAMNDHLIQRGALREEVPQPPSEAMPEPAAAQPSAPLSSEPDKDPATAGAAE